MSIEVGIDFLASLDSHMKKADADRAKRENIVYQVPLAAQLSANGTFDLGTGFEPTAGDVWSIRRLTVYGNTAGNVTFWLDNMEPVAPFPAPAVNTYGRGELLLMPGQRLWAVVTAIAGTALVFGRADAFPNWYLSEYLD